MQKLFNNIVIPVDFTKVTENAICKAIDLANEYHCNIHLLHVITVSPFSGISPAKEYIPTPVLSQPVTNKDVQQQLDRLIKKYEKNLATGSTICAHIVRGSWNESVIEFVITHKMDVVLIGRCGSFFRNRRAVLNSNKIAEKTNIPVITTPENRRLTKLYSIVIPITDFLPVKKLMYGIYMAQHHNATIKLLGIESDKDFYKNKKVQYYLKKSFQLIRDNCAVPLEIVTTAGDNVAEAVNQYATKSAADLVIVNPGRQSRLPGFLSFLFGNFLQRFSGPPVLTINPE
ncbi:MAG TPA: universal stress protein [Chitinophagaceae bacterium]|jgi:nucleotide-binding universal stress UspA family protein|nr:universal stress protein [Chitinophagaceae bacterium]